MKFSVNKHLLLEFLFSPCLREQSCCLGDLSWIGALQFKSLTTQSHADLRRWRHLSIRLPSLKAASPLTNWLQTWRVFTAPFRFSHYLEKLTEWGKCYAYGYSFIIKEISQKGHIGLVLGGSQMQTFSSLFPEKQDTAPFSTSMCVLTREFHQTFYWGSIN